MMHSYLKRISVFLLLNWYISNIYSQSASEDTLPVRNLQEVIIKAYEQRAKLLETPAAINYIGRSQLDRFNNTTILPALNATPGVRMEERSPGSYRLNIRGSSLRSPFGVRNVKVYYNNIPYTEPGGTTFLNQLGFYNFQSIEIIKGPGSSLYGAGTGGVMLIESIQPDQKPGITLNYSAGSYNLQNIHIGISTGANHFNYQHQSGNGYRDHTKLRRDVFTWDGIIKAGEKNSLSAHFLYGDLYYQTPGALTFNEYQLNSKAARPRTGAVAGAAENKAAIYQKTFLAGLNYQQSLSNSWQQTTTLYGAFTQLKNPTIRNYESTGSPHFGSRTVFQFKKQLAQSVITWHTGAEFQKGFSSIRTYKNIQGNPDSLQTNDDINNQQVFVFTQLAIEIKNWVINAGVSINDIKVDFTRLSNLPVRKQKSNFNNQWAPRLALLKKITQEIAVYASVAKGFSPPTTAELSPSGGEINTSLNPEQGINYEAGWRGSIVNKKLSFDINAFLFRLKNTIVQRRNAAGGDYFINAGATSQKGIESYLQYYITDNKNNFITLSRVWVSYTYNHFRYKNFKQLNNDFSGRHLPGIPASTIAAGAEVQTKAGIYLFINHYYSDAVPLDDGNTAYANSYNLLGLRAGYKKNISGKIRAEIFAGVDNLLNEKYSLGNDINGFGGRFYNAAPRINYYAGVSFNYLFKEDGR